MTERQGRKFVWHEGELQVRKRPGQDSEFIKRLRRLERAPKQRQTERQTP